MHSIMSKKLQHIAQLFHNSNIEAIILATMISIAILWELGHNIDGLYLKKYTKIIRFTASTMLYIVLTPVRNSSGALYENCHYFESITGGSCLLVFFIIAALHAIAS